MPVQKHRRSKDLSHGIGHTQLAKPEILFWNSIMKKIGSLPDGRQKHLSWLQTGNKVMMGIPKENTQKSM